MKIRAKFIAEAVVANTTGEQVVLRAIAKDDSDPEAVSFSQWTPSGQLTMQIDNPAACGKIEAGKAYYVDVTPAS